jgi:lauroyl/myristoyl acyltransferase
VGEAAPISFISRALTPLEHVDRAVKASRRMTVFSGHIANWEIAMLAGVQYGISVAQIYLPATIRCWIA